MFLVLPIRSLSIFRPWSFNGFSCWLSTLKLEATECSAYHSVAPTSLLPAVVALMVDDCIDWPSRWGYSARRSLSAGRIGGIDDSYFVDFSLNMSFFGSFFNSFVFPAVSVGVL